MAAGSFKRFFGDGYQGHVPENHTNSYAIPRRFFVAEPEPPGDGFAPCTGMMAEGAMVRLFLLKRFALGLMPVLMLLAVPSLSWAASGPQSGFGAWLTGFNVGSGALIINPVVILVQWANFLILLVILNKILIKPLMSHMESRDAQIHRRHRSRRARQERGDRLHQPVRGCSGGNSAREHRSPHRAPAGDDRGEPQAPR